jgi:hypothetical protein
VSSPSLASLIALDAVLLLIDLASWLCSAERRSRSADWGTPVSLDEAAGVRFRGLPFSVTAGRAWFTIASSRNSELHHRLAWRRLGGKEAARRLAVGR